MGIPIGLKLNSPLNQFLGKFFLHHVRLWLEYIQMILLAFGHGNERSLFWLLLSTCFGFSFFIAVCSDVLSVLSFHIYCFYVYAARLYGLQVSRFELMILNVDLFVNRIAKFQLLVQSSVTKAVLIGTCPQFP